MSMPICRKGICIIILVIFSFLILVPSLHSEEAKGLSEWRPFAFLDKEWRPFGESSSIKKFIQSYADYTVWDFTIHYIARDYEWDRPYYSWAQGRFDNRYPSFNFTLNLTDYLLRYYDNPAYGLNRKLVDAYFYISYVPEHKWKGTSYYYLGPYKEENLTINSWIKWRLKRGKGFYLTTGQSFSRTNQDQDPADVNFSGTRDWWYNPATKTWEYLPGGAAATAHPRYYSALGGYKYTAWDIYLGLGYYGKKY